jgi:uncharacterized protein (TIGR02001 family)
MLQGRSGGCGRVTRFACIAAFLAAIGASTQIAAADTWGGSLALTSDYFVRGISRSNGQAAMQADLDYSGGGGFVAGVFASSAQIDPNQPRDAELSGYVGFAWNVDRTWHGRIPASYYAYPWNQAGARYNYSEVDFDFAYQDWLRFSVDYSPNSPRYLSYPYSGVIGVNQKSAEMTLQRQIVARFSAVAGLGYTYLDGPNPGGYTYWSLGGACELKSVQRWSD